MSKSAADDDVASPIFRKVRLGPETVSDCVALGSERRRAGQGPVRESQEVSDARGGGGSALLHVRATDGAEGLQVRSDHRLQRRAGPQHPDRGDVLGASGSDRLHRILLQLQ